MRSDYALPKKKKYTAWRCKECEIDYYVTQEVKHVTYCPKCGDKLFTEVVRTLWLERPILYKRPWTVEEDELILTGVELGRTHKEIAKELNGRTPKAVTRRLQTLRAKGVVQMNFYNKYTGIRVSHYKVLTYEELEHDVNTNITDEDMLKLHIDIALKN